MHLGFDLCAEEKAFLSRRKQVVAKALKQALQLDRDLQEDAVCGGRGMGVQIPCTRLHGVPACYALSRYSSQQRLGSGHMWGDVGHGEALFGDLSKAESCHLLGRSRVLALTLTPSGSDLEVPSLEAGGSSIPVLVKPACVCVQPRSPSWASWPQEEVPGP